MKIQRHWPGLAAIALIVVGGPSQAISPVMPEQILCNSTYVIVADVLTATSADCRKVPGSQPTCEPRHLVRLKVHVKEILGTQPADAKRPPGRTLWAGETIDVTIPARLVHVDEKYDAQGDVVFRVTTGAVLPDERLHAAYAGQRFLMSLSMTKDDLEYRGTVSAHVWPITKKAWALETMSTAGRFGSSCARPS